MDEDQKERGVRSWMLRHLGMISEAGEIGTRL
jgi:hypothetical protein